MARTRVLGLVLLAALPLAACSNQVNPVTVNGMVVDEFGFPWAGQAVLISSGAFSQRVVSSSRGAFTVANVPTPYDATVFDSTSPGFIMVYVGLTRVDPTLTVQNYQQLNRTATFSGQLTGGRYPEVFGYSTEVAFASPQVVVPFQSPGYEVSGSYSTMVNWVGPTSTTGTLYALQIHSDAGIPLDYPGYGTLGGIVLQDQGSLTNQDVTLSPVTTGALSGTVSVPSGYALGYKSLALVAPSGAALPLSLALFFSSQAPADPSFSYATPSVPGTALVLRASAASGQGAGMSSSFAKHQVPANASGVTVSIPPAPSLLLPADGATGVGLATRFTWTPFAGGVHAFAIFGAQNVIVFTAATTATIPDLADAGFPLGPSYGWTVSGISPVASIDALAAPGGMWALQSSDYAEATSGEQRFATSP
jgi:hypothetical protein